MTMIRLLMLLLLKLKIILSKFHTLSAIMLLMLTITIRRAP